MEIRSSQTAAWKEWLSLKLNCPCATVVFRADGSLLGDRSRAATLKALNLTIDDARRRLCARKQKLRFVPYIGGEPDDGVAPHIHALIELPNGTSVDRMREVLTSGWCRFLSKRHGHSVIGSVLVREFRPSNGEEQLYYCRYEGPTFSSGLEKVLFEHMRL